MNQTIRQRADRTINRQLSNINDTFDTFRPTPIVDARQMMTRCASNGSNKVRIKLQTPIQYHDFFLPKYTELTVQRFGRWYLHFEMPHFNDGTMLIDNIKCSAALFAKGVKMRLL